MKNYISIPKIGNTSVVMVMSPTGSRFENPKYKGISHFLEHMCFKGTKKRTQKEIGLGIEKFGGDVNAFTDFEITAYWARIANKYRTNALNIITDMSSNPIIPSKEIIKEREVILQELKMYEDNPKDKVEDYMNEILYNKSSGFHVSTIGTRETLKRINRKELKEYHKKNYKDLTLIQVGDVEASEDYQFYNADIVLEATKQHKTNKYLIVSNEVNQANVIIANNVDIKGLRLDKFMAFKILSSIYNDMSGRLFTVIREKHNLVYRVHFRFFLFSCGGMEWGVTLGLEKSKINKAYDLIIKELTRPLTEKEIDYAVTKLIGTTAMILDNPLTIAQTTAYCLIQGMDYKEFIYNYKKHYKRIRPLVNDYQRAINFKNNILVGLVPKKEK